MMEYKHTQIGYINLVIFIIILFGIALLKEFSLIIILVLLILGSFLSLKVTLDKKNLNIRFGYGIFKKSFLLKDIVSVKSVKNNWYFGWGIRFWLWPRMWIYNISGFDAIEIIMKNKRVYRIGTDEPEKLRKAIKN